MKKQKQQGGRIAIYETGLKIAIARRYLSGSWSYRELGLEYGLSGGTVRHFVQWYQATYPDGEPATAPQEAPCSPEVEELRKQLKMAQLKVAAYETMMSIAQKELDIDIIKKFGTKPSGK